MSRKAFLILALIVGLPFLVWFAGSQSTALRSVAKTNPSSAPSMPSKEAVSAKLTTLERGWVKNEGQWDQRALFSAPGYFGTTWALSLSPATLLAQGVTYGPNGDVYIHTPDATYGPNGETYIHTPDATYGPNGEIWIHSY